MRFPFVAAATGAFLLLALSVGAAERATAVANVTAGFVTSITVTSSGSGYSAEPTVTITGGGGSGATAKALLSGDGVALVVVLTAGSGYTGSPTVTIEAPPGLGLTLELVPKLTVKGSPGTLARVEWADDLSGPWTGWSNVVVSAEGTVLVDLTPGAVSRFYRAVAPFQPAGFAWIAPGSFLMGSPLSEEGRDGGEAQHMVTLTQGFWLSDHEVTQEEYEAVMGGNPSHFKGEPSRPVEMVTWHDAVMYCEMLTEREREAGRLPPGYLYRLPTEAEWEYSARAGTTGARHGELDAIAWWDGNSGDETHPVKQKAANAWGLYDMMGNVWEWCSDWYGEYPTAGVTDPNGPSMGSIRVFRGSSWSNEGKVARSAFRNGLDPGGRGYNLGFRPALSSTE